MKFLTEDDKKNMRLEYELLKRGILERNRRAYFATSIIVPASLLAIIECFKYREDGLNQTMALSPFPIGVVVLCVVLVMLVALLFVHISAVMTNRVEYDTMNEIIESLGAEGFPMQRAFESRLKRHPLFRIRNYVWIIIISIFILVDVWALLTFWHS